MCGDCECAECVPSAVFRAPELGYSGYCSDSVRGCPTSFCDCMSADGNSKRAAPMCGDCACNECVPNEIYQSDKSFDAYCAAPIYGCPATNCKCTDATICTNAKELVTGSFALASLVRRTARRARVAAHLVS